ncbi:MAG: transposase [bacterium]
MKNKPHIQNRKSLRLKDYDYSQTGFYFVTIVIQDRECFFGEIKDGEMILNDAGKISYARWLWLKEQYHYVDLDEFVIMPNHIHGIIIINDVTNTNHSDRSRPVITKKIKPLPELIGAFKTTSSKMIHKQGLVNFKWQRSFYDHEIKNETDLNNIREYIVNNPLRWELDEENPKNFERLGNVKM